MIISMIFQLLKYSRNFDIIWVCNGKDTSASKTILVSSDNFETFVLVSQFSPNF